MKLTKVYIKEYKNIKEQTFDFTNDTGYIALIGENGSGKSNLLEAISLIFSGLLDKKKIPFEYSVDYEINGESYHRAPKIAKKNGVKVKDVDMIYPSSVIACYSGEDLRLWHNAYENYHMHYFNKAIKNEFIIPQLLYVNKYCWKIALISLLCIAEDFKMPELLKKSLNVSDLEDIFVSFKIDKKNEAKFRAHDAYKWFKRITEQGLDDISVKTIVSTDILSNNVFILKQKKCKTIFHYLYLLSQPEKNEINKVDKLITDISIKIGTIDFDNLSEGEKKLILVECVTQVLGDNDTLLLFDEPDAHTHIARKKDLLDVINSFSGQTILTTHSPLFVDMMDFNSLRYIENGRVVNMDRIKAIRQISNNSINVLDGAIIAASKKLIVTEGPDDVKHIKAAIAALSQKEEKYRNLLNIPVVFQGGAKMADDYYHSVIESVYDNIDKVVFVFDHDSEGRDGAKIVEKLKKKKLDYLFYYDTYPIQKNSHDFFLEDFYPQSAYSDVILPNIENTPTFFELKRCATLAKSVKDKIQKNMNNGLIQDDCFAKYRNFLDQLLIIFNI